MTVILAVFVKIIMSKYCDMNHHNSVNGVAHLNPDAFLLLVDTFTEVINNKECLRINLVNNVTFVMGIK
jgi:hypothetical protein